MIPLKIRGSLLARNTIFNFIGQVVPLLVGLVTIPFIVRGLGTERFGLLSLAWVVLGYFSIFDLGLGRATTKFVAESLGKGKEEEIPSIVWTAVTVQAIFGTLGGFVFAVVTPLLVGRFLNIPLELIEEAKMTFYLLALSLPVVLVSSSFRGVLEAAQRFDLVNAIRIPSSISTYLLTLIGLLLGLHLPSIVVLILVAKFMALLVMVVLDLRLFPNLRRFSTSFALLPHLFAFGGWVMVSSTVSPILLYFDRFLIASLLSLSAVAYYTVPYEAITQLWIIPFSLVSTLFPTFSTIEVLGDRQRLGTLFARSIKYLLLAVGPIVLMIELFANEVLQMWLGSNFAKESVTALQILALGVLINSLAQVPLALLQGVGRPDIPAKFYLLQLPLYIGIAWILVGYWGIAGAAVAWTLRVVLNTLLLFMAAFTVCELSPHLLLTNGITLSSFALLLLAVIAYGLKSLTAVVPFFAQSILFIVLFGLFAWIVWVKIMDVSDRGVILKAVSSNREAGVAKEEL